MVPGSHCNVVGGCTFRRGFRDEAKPVDAASGCLVFLHSDITFADILSRGKGISAGMRSVLVLFG